MIKEVLDSGLWGRGGAAFPTGRKWGFLRGAKNTPKYMICNADEGDPGSFVNRNLMESAPHLIVEGMTIGAYATGASRGYIYIREEYPLPVERMELAVGQAREKGLLGANILGSGFSFDLEVVRGAGSYVCGEETGLISSLQDARGMPKIRPPFPAEAGVFGQPTNVNNVESYANVPLILRQGADWYASQGSERHKGTKMFSLSGQVQRVGVLEVPLGTPTSDVVLGAGGGPPEGHTLKGIQPGGPLSGVIPAADVAIPLEPDPFRERGMLMGSGGLILLDDSNCIIDLAIYFEWFAEDESCGRCTTCFAGTRRLVEILRRPPHRLRSRPALGRQAHAASGKHHALRQLRPRPGCAHRRGRPAPLLRRRAHGAHRPKALPRPRLPRPRPLRSDPPLRPPAPSGGYLPYCGHPAGERRLPH